MRLRERSVTLFFFPGDWLTRRTTARTRLAVACWTSLFWLPPGPGFWMWLLWIKAIWFVGLMSIVALWMTGLSMVGTETPVESEDDVQAEQ